MILDLTTRKLQAYLAGAAATTNPTVTVIYHDIPNQAKVDMSPARPAAQFTVLAGATETDVCAAPAAGVIRMIDSVTIYNTDTASVDCFVVIDDSATNRIQAKLTIATTETALWTRESGKWNIST